MALTGEERNWIQGLFKELRGDIGNAFDRINHVSVEQAAQGQRVTTLEDKGKDSGGLGRAIIASSVGGLIVGLVMLIVGYAVLGMGAGPVQGRLAVPLSTNARR